MKILKNKRGFSLVELMVVVAIMGVLSAIAIPSYLTYQDNARQGVAESILHLVDRTLAIEVARGVKLSRVDQTYFTSSIWSKVQSNDKGSFTQTFGKDTTNNDKWCLRIAGAGDYAGVDGCVQNTEKGGAKVLLQVGADLDCAGIADPALGCSRTQVGCTKVPGTGPTPTGGTCTGTYSLTAVACSTSTGLCS